MNTYEVKWIRCPTAYNSTCLLYVDAISDEAAVLLAQDHIRRHLLIGDHVKIEASIYQPPSATLGRVLQGKPTP
jgi:hypothetical protein